MPGLSSLNLPNRMVRALLLVLGAAGAVALVWLGQSGGADMVVFVSVGVVVTVAALYSGEFGLMALLFVAAVDGFLKGLSPGWHTQLMKDYLIAICLLRWAWLSVMGHRRESVKLPVSLPILIFGGWVGVQLLNTRSESLLVSLAGFRMWVIWLPVFFLAYDAFDTRRKVERLVLFVLALMVPLSIYGIIQSQIGLDHLLRLGPGFDSYTYSYYPGEAGNQWRPPATMVSTHAFAGSLAMVVLMAIGAAIYFNRDRLLQFAIISSVPLMGAAMTITAVRNAAGSAVLGVAALLLIRRRLDLAILVAIIGSIAIFQVEIMTGGDPLDRIQSIVANRDYTVTRIRGPWRGALEFALKNPLGGGVASGVGIGRVGLGPSRRPPSPESRLPFIENEYGRALLELGMPGFIFFIWLLYAVTRNNYLAYTKVLQGRDKWLLAGIFAACVSMLARLLVGPALYGWPEAPIFWYYVAIAARMPKIEDAELARAQAANSESRSLVLGAAKLPWARDDD